MIRKIVLFLVLFCTTGAHAQNWDINRVPPQMQEMIATCYAIYHRTEGKGILKQNTEILKKLGIHDQIIAHPAYQVGEKIPFDTITRDQRDACKMAVYGMIGQAEHLFTGKNPKYTQPNLHYCLGYFKTVFNRDDMERSYCSESFCQGKKITSCVDKCIKKLREFKSFKMGITDGNMVDYKQLAACAPVISKAE
ncbi:MAG: hypothetical protein IKS41_02240 [Alphaproteobacteria bacterium]|nr:hypothetical protein [Alphaproteobacteria bacterium]